MSTGIDIIGKLKRIIDAIALIPTGAERGTDNAALAVNWTAALATALANYTAVRAAYLDELDFDLQAALNVIAAYVDDLETRLTAARAGYLDELAAANLPTDISTIDTVVDGIQTDLSNGTDGLGALKALLDAITPAGPTKTEMDSGHALLATEAKQDIIDTNVDQIEVLVGDKVMGRIQIAVHNDDLDSAAAGTYSLVAAVDQNVIIESIVAHCTRDLSGDAGFTGLSVQTDDTTPQIFIPQADGVKANLTAESQLQWTGAVLLKVGSYIEFTVYGGAVAGVTSLWDLVITYRAVVSGGYIA